MSILIRKAAVVAAGAGLALGGVAALAPAANAKPVLSVVYSAVGSSVIAKPNSTVKLGPTHLKSNVNANGSFTGSMPLPATSANFKIIGLLPVSATVTFTQAGQLTGQLGTNSVSATAKYYIRLSDVTVAGLPTFVGDSCQTSDPVSIPVATPAGQKFDLTKGGTVAGTYSIGDFANCGLTTGLINLLVPGDGNTVTLKLSNGKLSGS